MNQFILSTAWYSAIFKSPNQAAALAAYPTDLLINDGRLGSQATGFGTGGEGEAFPQGRNVTQFQVADDFSKTVGILSTEFRSPTWGTSLRTSTPGSKLVDICSIPANGLLTPD